MDLTVRALEPLISIQDTRVITPKLIMETVAKKHEVTVDDLLSKKRNREIAIPRQIAIYLCREMTDLSTTNIGREFGGRDHTTVMHSCDKVGEQLKSDYAFRKKMDELVELIKNA